MIRLAPNSRHKGAIRICSLILSDLFSSLKRCGIFSIGANIGMFLSSFNLAMDIALKNSIGVRYEPFALEIVIPFNFPSSL